jgi:hypothetical protein
MARNNTLTEPAGSAVNFVPEGTWVVSPGNTLTNPQGAPLSEDDRLALFERAITLDDIFGIPDVLHPLEQTFYPPIPEPQHKDDQPPEVSAELLVSANPVDRLFVETSDRKYFPTSGKFKGLPVRVEPLFPATAKLAYRRFWQNTFTITVSNAQNFTRAIETQEGMSEVDTTTLSGKLGFAKELSEKTLKLSAELSKTTEHAVTITENRSHTETYNFSVAEGKVAIYTLWQLVEVFALVDGNGNPIDWSGKVVLRLPVTGDKKMDAKFPPDRHTNHAERYVTSLRSFDA